MIIINKRKYREEICKNNNELLEVNKEFNRIRQRELELLEKKYKIEEEIEIRNRIISKDDMKEAIKSILTTVKKEITEEIISDLKKQ